MEVSFSYQQGGRLFEAGRLLTFPTWKLIRGGSLFEAGRLLTFPINRVGAYSRWALIRGWALNRINMVFVKKLTQINVADNLCVKFLLSNCSLVTILLYNVVKDCVTSGN